MSPIHPEAALELARQRSAQLANAYRVHPAPRKTDRRARIRWTLATPRLTRARA